MEGEVVVRRHEIGVVVGRLRVDVVAARRLHADDDVAEPVQGEAKRAVGEERVGIGRAPSRGQGGAVAGRQASEEVRILGQAKESGPGPPRRHAGRRPAPSALVGPPSSRRISAAPVSGKPGIS